MKWLLGLFNPVGQIISLITKERERQRTLESDHEKIASEERIKRLEFSRDLILSAHQTRWFWFMWVVYSLPGGMHNIKVVIWDKLLKLGTTDALTGLAETIAIASIDSIFLSGSLLAGTTVVAAALRGRR
jgi:hypothetical protein